ncbi:MAG: hypothetical protein A2X61_16465 [Ignavibacteria bacterium GWB2_35_12]|nr:MAG: hypothetical protein A2X63_14260 [Ignavibacteria bacterium GWA2_35_8]OGU38123.1 MAG: hypothetical protein A2X61_16465 [Ignavibacteria bacterium GWB2_35_12]OGU87015.1 MAG: hypothetical protein A2220_05700 [Ignavibacteria bacterium RIFOXYA2_FULL_35_10]OGV24895.1 MAG: hypothetical protein A2475_16090 [Ignavibacteria bacterium RIFOXYC2_FULL_35_21]
MKLLRSLITLSAALVLFFGMIATTFAKEFPAKKNNYPFIGGPKEMTPAAVTEKVSLKIKNQNTIQAVDFRIVDSLANAYSYFTDGQQPFVYHIPTGTLVTIKRGYFNLTIDPTYSGYNTLDNLFILQSTDLGQTWSAPKLVFDSKPKASTWGVARYPSVYPFIYDNKLTCVFTAPTNISPDWVGYVNGIINDVDSAISFNGNFDLDDQNYEWAGTESKILGGVINDVDPFGIAVGGAMYTGGTQYDHNSYMGYRKTMDFTEWDPVLPPQWASSLFHPVDQANYRSVSLVDLKYGSNNTMYMAVNGNFISQEPDNKVKVGVSISTDFGDTWSEFDVSPHQLLRDYATSQGFDADRVYMTYSGKGFVVFDNGDFSFALMVNDSVDISGFTLPYEQRMFHIAEIYKENNAWGLRKIAETGPYVLKYLPPLDQPADTNNQMGFEIQMSRTVDGDALICKWVDFMSLINQQTNDTITTTDIIVNGRYKNSSWGEPLDITMSEIWDRITWIPDFVPNGLLNVPILKVETVPNPDDDPITAKARQQKLVDYPQYVVVGNFDASSVLDVDESENTNSKLQITSIYPNPMDNGAEFNFNLPYDGKVEITICDLMGRTVKNVFNGSMGAGLRSVKLNTAGLPAGAYYCTITENGLRATKMITIVR